MLLEMPDAKNVRERMHFVDQIVPENVTDISTIKDMLEEYEEEEEEEEDDDDEHEEEDGGITLHDHQ